MKVLVLGLMVWGLASLIREAPPREKNSGVFPRQRRARSGRSSEIVGFIIGLVVKYGKVF